MNEPLDSRVKETFARQTDAVEDCLIAELNDRNQDCLASQSALANPVASILSAGYQKLVINLEIDRAMVQALRTKPKAYRKVKIRNTDLRDLSAIRDAVNGLGKELDAIAYADELYRAHAEHSSEVREELAMLTLVIQTADEKRLALGR